MAAQERPVHEPVTEDAGRPRFQAWISGRAASWTRPTPREWQGSAGFLHRDEAARTGWPQPVAGRLPAQGGSSFAESSISLRRAAFGHYQWPRSRSRYLAHQDAECYQTLDLARVPGSAGQNAQTRIRVPRPGLLD